MVGNSRSVHADYVWNVVWIEHEAGSLSQLVIGKFAEAAGVQTDVIFTGNESAVFITGKACITIGR